MNGYYKLVKKILEENGYKFLRPGNGSHEVWSNGLRHQTLSKTMPARHMANAIMKQAGIAHRF